MQNKNYYITTPIYYPSGKWHLGTCYTTVICDAIARFKRLSGYNVFYLTGTDEHGLKIEKLAKAQNQTPMEYLASPIDGLKKLWEILDIDYDFFIRTTDNFHEKAVQKIFTKLYEQGDIYKSEYNGLYCVPCESYLTKTQLVDGKCPDCGREVETLAEESYFFRLSKYQDKLIELIENGTFLLPKPRQKEMLNNFLLSGLQDLCVTRSNFDWGIKVPFDEKHTIYVWVDALSNYITALGYMGENDDNFKKYWPANLHMMGKEIVRFHSIIWPAMLMALDLPLPKQIYGHGWLLMGNDKMSKSKSNVVDPFILSNRYGSDSVRYFLLREIPFGQDGSYTNLAFIKKINSDLANDLGNLVSRSTAMAGQYFNGTVNAPVSVEDDTFSAELKAMTNTLLQNVESCMDKLLVPEALGEIWKVINRANKYIDETEPWKLNKEGSIQKLNSVIYNLLEVLRVATSLIKAFLPKTADKIFESIIVEESLKTFASLTFGKTKMFKTQKCSPLFPRLDLVKEEAELEQIALSTQVPAEKNNDGNVAPSEENKKTVQSDEKGLGQVKSEIAQNNEIQEIAIEQFNSVNLKVGTIISAQKVEKSDKLLMLKVDMGDRVRTIVSGIANHYSCAELLQKQVVVVANLKPCKLKGILSEGMILCAENDDGLLSLVAPQKKAKCGATVR